MRQSKSDWALYDRTSARSPMLLAYGIIAGGAVIGVTLGIAFLQQNAGSLFTPFAARVVLSVTLFAAAVTWLMCRR